MEVHRQVDITVPETDAGTRLDKFLAGWISDYSRVQLRRAISNGEVLVDGKTAKPSYRLIPEQKIECQLLAPAVELPTPENIPLDIIYEDEYLVAINKPSAMVVHPAKGHWKGTLVSALSHHFQSLSNVGGPQRPGIIHRLDRDTTGVIVIAKTDLAHKHIASQFEKRTTIKEYLCLTLGIPDRDRDNIDLPIGPHSYQRERMAVRRDHPKARNAQTFYEVQERFRHIALVKAAPKTGRTHQIRVHLTHLGYPILADKLYNEWFRESLLIVASCAEDQLLGSIVDCVLSGADSSGANEMLALRLLDERPEFAQTAYRDAAMERRRKRVLR